MADTTTTNLGLVKPEVGASADTWGTKLNTDLDGIDAVFAAAGTGTSVGLRVGSGKTIAVAGTLNVTGTLTGGVVAPLASPTFTGTVTLPSTTSIGTVSATEIGYLDGVTSGLQGQLDTKLAISTAASTYAPIASPTFTGTVVLPATTSIGPVTDVELGYLDGVTSSVQTQIDGKAALASPAFTGTPTAPTASTGTNTTQIATTAFVQQAAFNNTLPSQTGNAGKFVTTDGTNASWAFVPDEIPDQTGNAGKFLTTDGTDASWAVVPDSVTSIDFGTTGLTPATATNGDVVVAGTLGVANGGTGATSLTANAVLVGNGTSAVSAVAPGTSGNVLTSNGTTWTSAALPPSGPSLEAIASGTLADGSAVIINSDGTVSVVSGVSQALGTPTVFESANTSRMSAVYDDTQQKVVIAYADYGNSGYGTAIVGTVSGTSISFGTPVVFKSADCGAAAIGAAYDPVQQKVVFSYRDETGNLRYGYAVVGDVSGTSISFGTPVLFSGAETTQNSIVYHPVAQKVVLAYKGTTDWGRSRVGTISGTSISFGTEAIFESAAIGETSITYDTNAQKVVIVYPDGGNSSYGTAVVGTVSGTSISFGTPVVFESANIGTGGGIGIDYDPIAQKVVIAYADAGNSGFGTAIVGTVSGTSITFGTAVVYESASTLNPSIAYDAGAKKFVVAYRDSGNSSFGTAVVGVVSGNSIIFETPFVFENASTTVGARGMAYDANAQKIVIAYRDNANAGYGTAVVLQNQSTNITSENFIGFSDGAYTNGQTATIQIAGAVDDAQSGLTAGRAYYVQNGGTIGLTPDSPSVFAGTAVSATKIIVKG